MEREELTWSLFEDELVVLRLCRAIAIGVASGASSCLAQSAGSAEWFAQTWAAASAWKPDRPLHFRVAIHSEFHVDEREIAELRVRVGNATGGRDFSVLRRLEWERAHPAIDRTVDVCTDGTRFRYAESDLADATGLQFALGSETDWLIVDDLLRVAPADLEDAQYGVRNYIYTADQIVRLVVWAGLGTPPGSGLRPGPVHLDNNLVQATVNRGDGKPSSLIRGRVTPGGLPSINGVTIVDVTTADPTIRDASPLGHCEITGWGSNDALGRFVVNEVTWTDREHRLVRRMTLLSVEALDDGKFASVLALPVRGETDSLGYSHNFDEIQDVRPGHVEQKVRQDNAWIDAPVSIPVAKSDPLLAWLAPIAIGPGVVGLAWIMRRVGTNQERKS